MRFCRRPPPHPRLRRSSPAPTGGRGPCVAISGEQPYPGWSRREIVSGVELVGNRIRLFPTYPLALDRGDIATGGEADGEGELVPPPLSPTLQPSYFSPAPRPRLRRDTHALLRQPPPHPRLRRSSPAPAAGARSVRGDTRWEVRIRGGAGGQPYPALSHLSPVHWTVVHTPLGEAACGEGERFPPPLSLAPPRSHTSRQPYSCSLPASPAPHSMIPPYHPESKEHYKYRQYTRYRH